jgi:selenocysteine lyase/cysteine desulfurase
MLEQLGDYERRDWTPALDARRFECGSPNLTGTHGLEASLALLQEVGLEAVQAAIEARIDHLIAAVDARGYELLSPREPDRRAGILTFRVPGVEPQALYAGLMSPGTADMSGTQERFPTRPPCVLCAQRGGGVRFSPHFYTPFEDLDRAMDLVAAELR